MSAWAEQQRRPDVAVTKQRREVVGWRFERLLRAGYTEREAMVVADRVDVDLHLAVELLESGCPRPIALRILL